jgi:hypothetical protein
MGKKLTVYMVDGTEFGPRIAEIGNWVGKALYATRASISSIINRPEFSNPGVYCLKSSPNNDFATERIYIGEAENIGARLKQHLANSEKDFEELIFFISKDELLTKTQIKYLESRLVEMANEAKTAEVENGTSPSRPKLHEADISDMEYYLEQIKLILPIMGFKFLIPTVIKTVASVSQVKTENYDVFKIKSPQFNAQMFVNEQGFVVKKGSQANKVLSASISSTYISLREKLLKSGVLIDTANGLLEFSEDTVFSSPSAASNIILGRQSAGPIEWINSKNKTYKEVAFSD